MIAKYNYESCSLAAQNIETLIPSNRYLGDLADLQVYQIPRK